jgi:hypothetical protein
MRLKKAQKEVLLSWLAEGLETPEVNKRAALFEPHFEVNRSACDYYRQRAKIALEEIRKAGEQNALATGLALKENRVKKLSQLASLLEDDLFASDLVWTDQVKMIGSGSLQERVEYNEFNGAEIQQYRGLLEDISKEVGERVQKTEVTGKDGEPLKIDDDGRDRAISSLIEAIRETISRPDAKQAGTVDAAVEAPVASPTEPGG